MPQAGAEHVLLACCGARRWARAMVERRPFSSRDALLAAADDVWRDTGPDDWREAFAAHPRIGERAPATAGVADDPARTRSAGWSAGEQEGAAGAAAETRERLAAGNRAYETRFGYIFIVCATGRSAEEMLAMLESRMENAPDEELRVAAEEQRKITRLRLEKSIAATPPEASG